MPTQLKLLFKEFMIIDIYVSYFRWKDRYTNTKIISDIEGLPEHANSIKVRLDSITKIKNNLERMLRKIRYDYRKMKEQTKRKYDAYGRDLTEPTLWENGWDGWKVHYKL